MKKAKKGSKGKPQAKAIKDSELKNVSGGLSGIKLDTSAIKIESASALKIDNLTAGKTFQKI
jgi:hypothetical protein